LYAVGLARQLAVPAATMMRSFASVASSEVAGPIYKNGWLLEAALTPPLPRNGGRGGIPPPRTVIGARAAIVVIGRQLVRKIEAVCVWRRCGVLLLYVVCWL